MALSFLQGLVSSVPANLQGAEQCEFVGKWLSEHPAEEAEGAEILRSWLIKMREIKASDIDFGAPGCGGKVWMRIYGSKKPYSSLGEYSYLETAAIMMSWLSPVQRKKLFNQKSIDFSMSFLMDSVEARFRGSAYFDRGYLAVNFRRINDDIFTMESLNMPAPIVERMNLKYEKTGLVLITGITGSGKSSTLDAVIDMNNKANEGQIIIIGNPIEYVHASKRCLVRHREVGTDVSSFESGAIDTLRQDPDIIVVGEMRDARTIATVLEITDSGHKSFTTLHTSSAIDSIHRIIAEFPPEEQERIRNRLADVLSISISQKLVPTIDGKLVMVKEILSTDSSVKAAIRNQNIGEIYQMMIEGRKFGMCTMEQDLRELLRKGIITQQTAINFANNKKRMIQLLQMN